MEHFSDGDRFVVSQKIAYPLQGAGWFIKPQAELIGTWYSLDTPYSREFGETSISRTVPVFSVDSGLIFEKNMSTRFRPWSPGSFTPTFPSATKARFRFLTRT